MNVSLFPKSEWLAAGALRGGGASWHPAIPQTRPLSRRQTWNGDSLLWSRFSVLWVCLRVSSKSVLIRSLGGVLGTAPGRQVRRLCLCTTPALSPPSGPSLRSPPQKPLSFCTVCPSLSPYHTTGPVSSSSSPPNSCRPVLFHAVPAVWLNQARTSALTGFQGMAQPALS